MLRRKLQPVSWLPGTGERAGQYRELKGEGIVSVKVRNRYGR